MRSAQTGFEGDRQQCIEYIEQYTRQLPLSHVVFEFVVSNANDLRNSFRHVAQDILPLVRGFETK